MNQFFFLTWSEATLATGVAYTPEKTPLAHELVEALKDADRLPFDLELRQGELDDYLGNSLAWPLMSETMKNVVEATLTGTERVSWMMANVLADGRSHVYFIPKFNKRLDVLDYEKTKYVNGTDHIIKACFSLNKIKGYRMFPKPSLFWRITPSIYVDSFVRQRIVEAGVTGIEFGKATIA